VSPGQARYPDLVEVTAARPARRYQSRPGRLALVTDTLTELQGPTRGTVELPHRMVWQSEKLRRFDLNDSYQLGRVYEIVLREAIRLDELRTWLDGATLRHMWPDLYLPRGVRHAWEDRHPDLMLLRTVAP
jgi:hypothetical protein